MTKNSLKQANIMGINFTSAHDSEVLEHILGRIKSGKKTTVFTPNPEIIVRSKREHGYKNILNSSDLNLADGVGVLLACKILNKKGIHRYPGRNLFLNLLEASNIEKYKVYLLGASEKVNDKSVRRVKEMFPNIKVKGNAGPALNQEALPTNAKEEEKEKKVLEEIRKYKPDILFVALGAPKQEKWIYKNRKLPATILVAVGGSLDYFSGSAVLPPTLISRLGLEWLWRVILSPRRIKRIFNATIIFSYYLLKEKTKRSS